MQSWKISFQSASNKGFIFHDYRVWQISVYLYGNMFIRQEYQLIFTWWRHQMETFSMLLAICARNSPGPWWIPHTKASDAELWCFLWSASEENGWINNREAGDLRRYDAHYDVIVMTYWPHMLSDILVNISSGNEWIYLLLSIKPYI